MRNLPRKDYYGTLSLPYGAGATTVKRRYRELAMCIHPDVNRAPNAAARFRAISEAYRILMDPELKAVVDGWYESRPRFDARRAGVRGPAASALVVPKATTRHHVHGSHALGITFLAFFSFGAALVGAALVNLSFADQIAASSTVAFFSALVAACDADRSRELAFWITNFW